MRLSTVLDMPIVDQALQLCTPRQQLGVFRTQIMDDVAKALPKRVRVNSRAR